MHKVYFEAIKQQRFVFCSIMAGCGRLLLYWVSPAHQLHIAASRSVCEHQIMDLARTGPHEYLSPVYLERIYRIRLVAA